MNSTTNIAASESDPSFGLALAHDTIKALFANSRTPSDCSAQADFYAKLSDEATYHAQAMAAASVSRAFNEQRHMLREIRDFGPSSPMAREHSIARDRALAEVGL
jgi:hypothetical protein